MNHNYNSSQLNLNTHKIISFFPRLVYKNRKWFFKQLFKNLRNLCICKLVSSARGDEIWRLTRSNDLLLHWCYTLQLSRLQPTNINSKNPLWTLTLLIGAEGRWSIFKILKFQDEHEERQDAVHCRLWIGQGIHWSRHK